MSLIGLFLLWQFLALWGALRLVRFGRGPRLPRPSAVGFVPREFVTGEWVAGQGAPTTSAAVVKS